MAQRHLVQQIQGGKPSPSRIPVAALVSKNPPFNSNDEDLFVHLPTISTLQNTQVTGPSYRPIGNVSEILYTFGPTAALRKKLSRNGRYKYTDEQDVMILREVATKRAHVAGYGQKEKSFHSEKDALIATGHFKENVTGRNIRVRYNRLQKCFNQRYSNLSKIFDVEGALTEAKQLLSAMREDVEKKLQPDRIRQGYLSVN